MFLSGPHDVLASLLSSWRSGCFRLEVLDMCFQVKLSVELHSQVVVVVVVIDPAILGLSPFDPMPCCGRCRYVSAVGVSHIVCCLWWVSEGEA